MSANTTRSSSSRSNNMTRFQPSDAKKASLDASIFLTRLLSKVPPKSPELAGRRGFALQAATTEHLRLLWPDDNRPFVTAALCSAMIDKCKADAGIATLIASWLDDLAAAGVGKAEADEWAARRGAVAKNATATVNGLAALAGVAAMGQNPAPAPAATAPVTPAAPSATEAALRAEVEAMKAAAAAREERMEAMMQQMMALMAAAAAPKAAARKGKKVEVTVASTDSSESAES